MKTNPIRYVLFTVCALFMFGAKASTYEQVIQLQPGWNAIYVEVQPEVDSIEQVFAGIPVASVWRWLPDDQPVAFIQDPDEELLTIDGWYGYFPPERPESVLTNLYTISANQPYLVRLLGSQPVELRIEGRPLVRRMRWRSDDFQFTGFPVDPDNPPTFANWFAGSEAHADQSIFRLSENGEWVEIAQPFSERIQSGEAYWVFTRGRSTYQGPLEVELEFDGRLDFGGTLARDGFTLRNASGLGNQITLRQLDSDVPVPLAVRQVDDATGSIFWPVLPREYTVALPVDEAITLRLGVRRADLLANDASHIIEITNGFGARRLLEVSAAVSQPIVQTATATVRRSEDGQLRNADPRYAGLWLGVISIDAVSQAQQGGVMPTPVGREFNLRVLMHVDASGTTRMLKEVIQMWQDGTEIPDPDNPGFFITETPGRNVLVTREELIPNFSGAVLRGGEPVGLRVSTAGFDFEGPELELAGAFGANGLLTGSIVLDPEFPTNPFLHRYHPDHDNLDPQFLNFREEAFEVTREFEFFFSLNDPEQLNPPEYGDEELAGAYSESISGLHRSTVFVSGTFRMRRVSTVPLLNQ
ncbi:hypothetical protein [Wenzhouxiangella marina]|uniref:Uncharacterized protein n=1 Tax=Wenzhouxiangella marina TaxID=1579979 RepID=A0A0K0XY00_9GAMM|nr:hypothetical protein [Wenzhouxiangella marina]AKS42486.1 hypothetical protein WM2015_2121 [Wenzhouxiangella marina]MBB6085739.1 hypothetical protein [Wenzhouxiangella marina]